jgi:sarcosine oxidase
MSSPWDVIVLGLGGMGSAAAAHLAARGQRVLGLEQFMPAHDRGSSHGESRIIRQAYFEDPAYVPLLLRSYELWQDLDRDRPGVLTITGGLMIGRADSATVSGSLRSAQWWDLPYEMLDAAQLRRRFPVLRPTDETTALYEARGGFTRPEQTVLAHLDRAAARGADLRFGEKVIGWHASSAGEGVTVRTHSGEYEAGRLVIAPGAWAPELLPGLARHLTVERQVLFWMAPTGDIARFRAPAFPVFVWEDTSGTQIYGFPAYGADADGVKVAFFRNGTPSRPGCPRSCRPRRGDRADALLPHVADPRTRRALPARAGLHVHDDTRPALRAGPPSPPPAGDHRCWLLRTRLQVRAGRGRDHRRPDHPRIDRASDRAIRPHPLPGPRHRVNVRASARVGYE